MQSRIIISGRIGTAEDLDRLIAAIRKDRIPVYGPLEFFNDSDALEYILAAGGGPLVIEDDYRGRSDFENVRLTCEALSLAYVHEASSENGFSCSAHDPDARTGSKAFSYEGRAGAPMFPLSQIEDAGAMTDEELGNTVRRIHLMLSRGAEIAGGGFLVPEDARPRSRVRGKA